MNSDIHAEKSLLYCVLSDPYQCGATVLDTFRSHNPFTNRVCRMLYHYWAANGKGPFDPMDAFDKLTDRDSKTAWDIEIRDVMGSQPSIANFNKHLDIVREHYTKSKLKVGLQEVLTTIDNTDSGSIADAVTKVLLEATTTEAEREEVTVQQAIQQEMARRQDPSAMMDTGWSTLDSLLGPISPGSVMIVGARPAVGKSVVATNVALHLARSSAGGFLSLEMPIYQQVARSIAACGGINSREIDRQISSGSLDNTAYQHYNYVQGLPIHWYHKSGITINQLESKVRRWKKQHEIRWVAVDYLQLMTTSQRGRSRSEEVTEISQRFKNLCLELGLFGIALCQLNRASADGQSSFPLLSQLRESGSLEQDADYVILLNRDIILTPEQRYDVETKGKPVDCEVIVAKNRHGMTGVRTLKMYLQYCKLSDERIDDVEFNQISKGE